MWSRPGEDVSPPGCPGEWRRPGWCMDGPKTAVQRGLDRAHRSHAGGPETSVPAMKYVALLTGGVSVLP